jgi:hypothetical protein
MVITNGPWMLVVSLYVTIVYFQEEERQSKQDLEMGGWRGIPTENEDTVQAAPIQQNDMPPPAAKGNLDVVKNKF